MSRTWGDFTIWLRALRLRWKYRKDTPEQRRDRLYQVITKIRDILSEMPADKSVHMVYELCEKIESESERVTP